MKIAILSDIHLGPSGYYKGIRRKLTEFAEEYIGNFVKRVSESTEFQFAVHLGDIIQDCDIDTDRANLRKALSLFSGCSKPIYHLVGNHDVKFLTVSDVVTEFQYSRPFYSFDHTGFHFIVLFTEVLDQANQISFVSAEQMSWLAKDLSQTELPTVVFAHHSLADQDLTGNPWFEGRPEACLVENRKAVREILIRSGKVRCVLNGHLHWNGVDIHSRIPFITLQSATENFNDAGTPANTWTILELNGDIVSVAVMGNDSMNFSYSTCRRAG